VGKEVDDAPDHESHRHLSHNLVPADQSLGFLLHHFEVVVQEPDGAERRCDEDDQHDVDVADVSPQQRGNQDRRQNDESPHRRRAGLGQVRFRRLELGRLTDLFLPEDPDDLRTEPERDHQSRQRGGGRTEGEKPEQAEARRVVCFLNQVEKIVEHVFPISSIPAQPNGTTAERSRSSRNATTSSIFMPRDPFTRTASPGAISSVRYSASTFF